MVNSQQIINDNNIKDIIITRLINNMKIILKNNNETENNDDEEINEKLINFFEEIHKNPEEYINKLLEYNFPYIDFKLNEFKQDEDKFIEYTLRPIINFFEEKEKINIKLNNENEKNINFNLSLNKIKDLIENDDEIIKIINEKIKRCPLDELEKRIKNPNRTKEIAQLYIKNKNYLYLLWIKYYFKLYINLLYDYNELINKCNKLNNSIDNLDYYDLYNKYKSLELEYNELINYFNDLKTKFENLKDSYKYMINKYKLNIKKYKSNHIILRDKFFKIQNKQQKYITRINILQNQLNKTKKDNELLQTKINDYNNLILNADNLDELKEKIKSLNY